MEAHHLKILYNYVQYCITTKDVRHLRFHNKYKPFSRKQSTFRVLKNALNNKIIFSPRLFCIQKVEIELLGHRDSLLVEQFENASKSESTYYAVLLVGSHSLLSFSKSNAETNLKYAECIMPTYPSKKKISEINPCLYEPEKLPVMEPPFHWTPFDWEVYTKRNDPLVSSVKLGEELGTSHMTILDTYHRILEDCTIWIPFFPLGYDNYAKYFISFKTDFETGFIEELKKIDRSSYIYKINDTILLNLFFEKDLKIDSIMMLEKKGIIHELRVSYPIWSFERFQP